MTTGIPEACCTLDIEGQEQTIDLRLFRKKETDILFLKKAPCLTSKEPGYLRRLLRTNQQMNI